MSWQSRKHDDMTSEGFQEKKYFAYFIVIISVSLTLIYLFKSLKVSGQVSIALALLIDQYLYIVFISINSIQVFDVHTKW